MVLPLAGLWMIITLVSYITKLEKKILVHGKMNTGNIQRRLQNCSNFIVPFYLKIFMKL
jgi:hypothetical protein